MVHTRLPDKWVRSFAGTESAFPNVAETARVVGTDAPPTCREHGLPHGLGMIVRYKSHHLGQRAIGGSKNAHSLQPKLAAHHGIDPMCHIVQVGVDGIEPDTGTQGCHDGAFHFIATRDALQWSENYRVVADNQTGPCRDGFSHNFFGDVQGDEHSVDLLMRLANEESAVVIVLLQGRRCDLLKEIDDLLYAWHGSNFGHAGWAIQRKVAFSRQMSLSGNPRPAPTVQKPAPINLRDRWWWAPLAWIFRCVVKLRHLAYDTGLRHSKKGALPSVVLGNITVGGTGKTPHVIALTQALLDRHPERRWAILSRGYGRKTKGFLKVERDGTPEEFGDEPLELARRFPKQTVAVSEDRRAGLEAIRASRTADAVILDDGFQHRRLEPTYSIVLADTTQPIDRDYFLPRGRLRDLPQRVQRADAVVLTRCTDTLTKGDLRLWRHRLHLRPDQLLLHSGTMVDGLRNLHTKRYAAWPRACIAVSGIANPLQFEASLGRNCAVVRHFAYPDHHVFTPQELVQWKEAMTSEGNPIEAIITTEKTPPASVPWKEHPSFHFS